jgi:hypothetical protein
MAIAHAGMGLDRLKSSAYEKIVAIEDRQKGRAGIARRLLL